MYAAHQSRAKGVGEAEKLQRRMMVKVASTSCEVLPGNSKLFGMHTKLQGSDRKISSHPARKRKAGARTLHAAPAQRPNEPTTAERMVRKGAEHGNHVFHTSNEQPE